MPIKLNLGCGGDLRPGYHNIDLYGTSHDHIRGNVEDLEYEPGSIEEIIAQDVLEHVSHRVVLKTLRHWCDLLAPGGRLEIRCPDIEKQCRLLLDSTWDAACFSYMMFGGQDFEGNYHKTGFTLPYLCHLLVENRMEIVAASVRHTDITSDIKTSSNPNLHVVAMKL